MSEYKKTVIETNKRNTYKSVRIDRPMNLSEKHLLICPN